MTVTVDTRRNDKGRGLAEYRSRCQQCWQGPWRYQEDTALADYHEHVEQSHTKEGSFT